MRRCGHRAVRLPVPALEQQRLGTVRGYLGGADRLSIGGQGVDEPDREVLAFRMHWCDILQQRHGATGLTGVEVEAGE